ncbi:MAG: FtsX-like permease family protein [Desulfamplus sp.]|nr:FtsX-like permease family protein [Desulfamplus sp.]
MKFLFIISLRNLFRQKRRNILLGSAMAFGVMILIIANSFSHGISDILFNRIVVYVAGHVNISINEGKGRDLPLFRDRDRLTKIAVETAGDKLIEYNEGVGIFLRAIGNGKVENLVLVGINTISRTLTQKQREEINESFKMLYGKFKDLGNKSIENPAILSKEKADALSVKPNDIVRVRYRNIYGQTQSSRLTVVGIMSNDNIFMQGVMFVELTNLKEMMGYRPYECGSIKLTLKEPQKDAADVADKIHSALRPGPAFILATAKVLNQDSSMNPDVSTSENKNSNPNTISSNNQNADTSPRVTLIPFMGNDEPLKKLMLSSFKLSSGNVKDVFGKDGMMVSDYLADILKIKQGDKLEFHFKPKFITKDKPEFAVREAIFSAVVKGIFISDDSTGKETIYMHEALFYPKFYENLPDLQSDSKFAFIPKEKASFKPALGTEWVLLDRSRSTDDLKQKLRAAGRKKIKAATIDVNSMYESASDVLKLENALNIITFTAVLILFFIILVGVVNTLRMTIRERTREIGTIRAIGMQKKDVLLIFVIETAILTAFASIAGTILAFISMAGLSNIAFQITDNPMGILLVKDRLHFVPTFIGIVGNIGFILFISIITAFFPSRKAANLSAADALRHFE